MPETIITDELSKQLGAAAIAQRIWESLEPICNSMNMVSARLDTLEALLYEQHDLDRGYLPGLASMIEREQEEVSRLAEKIEIIMQECAQTKEATS